MASFCPTENLHGGIESKFFQLLKWISLFDEKRRKIPQVSCISNLLKAAQKAKQPPTQNPVDLSSISCMLRCNREATITY